MTHIPQSDILSTTNLSRVFNSTTATYKFYWFLSLLQMHNEEGGLPYECMGFGYQNGC